MCVQCGDPDGQRPSCDRVREDELPTCIRDTLDAARAGRPATEVTCISFRTLQDGQEIVQMGPPAELLNEGRAGRPSARVPAKELLVLSVTVTETTFDRVQSVSHVLVARVRSTNGTPSSDGSSRRDEQVLRQTGDHANGCDVDVVASPVETDAHPRDLRQPSGEVEKFCTPEFRGCSRAARRRTCSVRRIG